MERKKFDTRKYIIVFAITTIIFIAGLFVGSLLSTEKLTNVRNLQDSLRSDTLDLEVLYAVLEKDPCAFINTSSLTEQLYDIGIKLDYMEGILGKNDEQVLRLKKYYSLLQIRQWLFEGRALAECEQDTHTLLYFYDNEPGVCDSCQEQGFILSYLREEYGISIYSFDVHTDSQALDAIMSRYEVVETPTIVFDDEVLVGFQTTRSLEERITK